VAIKPPTIEIPLLKRLGEPAFAPDLHSVLLPVYQAISRAALEAGLGEEQSPQP
jgi:hypothetical protein